MLPNKHFAKATVVLIAIALLGLATFVAPVTADGHINDKVDLGEQDELTIRYSTVVGLHGTPIDQASDDLVVELVEIDESYTDSELNDLLKEGRVVQSSGITKEQISVNGSDVDGVVVNTEGIYDTVVTNSLLDPQGDYVVREAIQGASLNVQDQHPEVPSGVDAAITDVTANSGDVILQANTTSQTAGDADYTFTVEIDQDNVEEDGSNVPSGNPTVLLDSGDYSGIAYRGLDGIYGTDQISDTDPNNILYPGSLSIDNSPGSFGVSNVDIEHQDGQLEINQDIPGPAQLDVSYEDASNRQSNTEVFDGPVTTGTTLDLSNSYLDLDTGAGDDNYLTNPDYTDTSLDVDLTTELAVYANYEYVAGSARTPVDRNNNGSGRGYNVENGNEIVFTESRPILLDTLTITDDNTDGDTEFTDSDVTVERANVGSDVRLVIGDGSQNVNANDVTVEYEVPNLADPGTTIETAVDETVVDFGNGVSSGQTRSLDESDVVVEVQGGAVTGNRFEFKVIDQRLTQSNTTLSLPSDLNYDWNVDGITGSLNTVVFNSRVNQAETESFDTNPSLNPNNLIRNINPELSEIELGFDMTPNQNLTVFYGYYDTVTEVNTEEIVGSNEFGPDGVYDVEDPRATPRSNAVSHGYEVSDATASDFDVVVEPGTSQQVRIQEGNFGSFTGGDNVDLDTYKYNISVTEVYEGDADAVLDVANDGKSAQFTFTPIHDPTQAAHDFELQVNTEDGSKTDTVTVDSNLPEGSELSESSVNTLLVDNVNVQTGLTYALLVIDPDGDLIGVEVQDEGRNLENLRVDVTEDLSQYDGEELTVRMMRYKALQPPAGQPNDLDSIDPADVDLSDWVVVRNENIVNPDSGEIGQSSPVEETVRIDSSEPIPGSVPSENEGTSIQSALSQNFTLDSLLDAGEKDDQDRRVYNDRLNLGESQPGPIGIPVGSEIVVSGNAFSPGDTVVLRPESGEDRDITWTADQQVQASSTVNENEVVINTSVPSVSETGELADRFEIVDRNNPEDVIFNYATTDQSVSANIDPEFVNLNADPRAELNVESQIEDYDLLISSEQLDAQDLLEDPGIFNSTAEAEYDIEIEDPADNDNEQVRLKGLSAGEETIGLLLENVNEGEYGLQLDVVGSRASTQATFQTAFGPDGSASFISAADRTEQKTFRAGEGDRARIGIDLQETDTVTFRFAEGDYPLGDVQIQSEEDAEEIELVMDTYRASGEDAAGNDVTFTDVFEVESGTFQNAPSLPDIDGEFEPGLYPIELEVDGEETDLATLVVEERETRNVQTWVMPRGTDATVQNVLEEANQQEDVAEGDVLVLDIQATGLDSEELITNNTDPAKLVNPYRRAEMDDSFATPQDFVDTIEGVDTVENASQVNIEIDGDKPSNRPSPQMLLDEAREIRTVVDQGPDNRFFVFLDMNTDAFSNFDTDSIGGVDELNMFDPEAAAHEDYLTNYNLTLNFTESYPYVEDDENDADFETEMSVNERRIFTQLPVTQVDEEDLDTRFALQQDENATVRGDTYVAPGTEVSIVVRDDISRTVVENPRTITAETEIQDEGFESSRENTVSADFDLSGLEQGRQMTLSFMGVNDNRDPAIIEEPDVPPEITDVVAESSGEGTFVGDEITFNAEIENVDPTTVQYEWDFGDGGNSGAPGPTHVYDEAGNYDVNLTVTDPQTGLQDSFTLSDLVITEVPRTAPEIQNLIGPEELEINEAGEFAVVATDEQADPDELVYEWDFGDGSTGTGLTATNSYSIADTYTVQVTVSDPEDPEAQATQDILVEVVDPAPEQPETQEFELQVFAQDTEAGAPLPNTAIQIQNDQGESVDVGETNQQGTYTTNLEEGNYQVQGSAAGYESANQPVQLTDNSTVQLDMTPESGGGDNNNTNNQENPDQPGFTLLLAAVGLAAAGGYIYYRRRIQ